MKKILFTVKLLKTLKRDTVMVNIDELLFSKYIKINYSWSKSGMSSNLSTEKVKGSVGIISSIMSDGLSFTGILKATVTSKIFIEYIKSLLITWNQL